MLVGIRMYVGSCRHGMMGQVIGICMQTIAIKPIYLKCSKVKVMMKLFKVCSPDRCMTKGIAIGDTYVVNLVVISVE